MKGYDQHGYITAEPEEGESAFVRWYRRGVWVFLWTLVIGLVAIGVLALLQEIIYGRLV